MKNKKYILILSLFFGLINLKLQCNKDRQQPPDYKYQFSEKISVSPYRLNYHVGDTIMLQLDVPGKKLFDSKTNSEVYYDSVSFNIGVNVNLVFNNPYIGDGPFASFIFYPGVSAYSQTYSGTTLAFLTTGCNLSSGYQVKVGVVLLKKGVFAMGVYNSSIQNCFNGNAMNAQVQFSMDIDDTHTSYYQGLPFSDIGKFQDKNVLFQLDSKMMAIINVE
ncbi:MAG: hypothetical protein ABI237_19555 [Ginsengibacter sp.]